MPMTGLDTLAIAALVAAVFGFVLGVRLGRKQERKRAVEIVWIAFYQATNHMVSGSLRLVCRQMEALMRDGGDARESDRAAAHQAEWKEHVEARERHKLDQHGGLDDDSPPPGWIDWKDSAFVFCVQQGGQEHVSVRGVPARAGITEEGLLVCTLHEWGCMPDHVAIWLLFRWKRWKATETQCFGCNELVKLCTCKGKMPTVAQASDAEVYEIGRSWKK